ncbi:hypothetical protein JMJ55_12695 [Belnapia sp. T6]|uniref:Uncharacterized protein n=1 Tax=Belnapia mucosa TaxID=2804532 RepID=A0ABS1V4Y7_9PROT|nr:hypothetical protein [Belnapia mucosa]MBL6456186.1 hypothetical protein [Belnapia mucosa]
MSNKHNTGPDNRGDGRSVDTPRPPDDLERNPGIGSSKGVYSRTGVDPETIEGDNTAEGDVMNDVSPSGAVTGNQGRTNK